MGVVFEREASRADRLDRWLASEMPSFSRSRVAGLIKEGAVTVAGRVVTKSSHRLEGGEWVSVAVPDLSPSAVRPEALPLTIVFEDEHVVVVNKAAGMVVHPGAGNQEGTLVHALLHHVQDLSGIGGVERPGIVHRLDRGTSGLMIVAKHDVAHQGLADQFAVHSAERRYIALVHRAPASSGGTIRSYLGRDPKDRLRFSTVSDPEYGRLAVTHWRRLGVAHGAALVECWLETGRTHQIRVHLTEAGHPLIGDPVYRAAGCSLPMPLRDAPAELASRPMLHAWSLTVDHPVSGQRLRWVASPPDDFARALHALELTDNLPHGLRGG